MKPRMVVLGAVWLAGSVASAEPPAPTTPTGGPGSITRASAGTGSSASASPNTTPAPNAKVKAKPNKPVGPPVEVVAESIGVTPAELKRLRELGFGDSEVAFQVKEQKRTARQLILEREVLGDVSKALTEVNARVYQMDKDEQTAERERSMKAALAKVRRDHKMTRDELRRVLASTSFFTPDELKRVLGFSLFSGAEELTRAFR
jgi:hypothetical protein